MSKRGASKITGPDRNLVDTPPEPVAHLLRLLPAGTRYSEPCAGAAVLIGHLETAGHRCMEAFDIAPRNEAYDSSAMPWDNPQMVEAGDATTRVPQYLSISNPPYERALLMPILSAAITWPHPSWWLLPHDTIANRYFGAVSAHISAIAPVGRVSWIRKPDGAPTGPGFENYTWVQLSSLRTNLIKERI